MSGFSWFLQAANLTEEDIDQIIQKGERATEELNNKMTEFTENAMKFTLDGGFTPYEFRDADEDAPHDPDALRALMGKDSHTLVLSVCTLGNTTN